MTATLAARAERTSKTPRDVVSVLSLYAVLRIVLPAEYVIGAMGAAGQPAQLLGLGVALWWVADWLNQPRPRSRVKQPLKRLALVFLMAVLASYLVAAIRPFSPNEQLAADRSLLNVIVWVGVMLAAVDGIKTRARLDTLLRRLVLLGALEGAFGLLQVVAKQTFIQYFRLPGLADNGVDPLLIARGSFLRAVGTAIHPIEYGVALSMLLPIALHYAVADNGHRTFLARWFPVGAIAIGLSQSVSRSAVVCTAIGFIILLVAWPPKLRRRAYLVTPALVAVLALARPGFIRTFVDLFSAGTSDPSILSRTNSYAIALAFIERAPVFGRGMGTFLPEYWILDNQYLGSLIELGVVGLTCMLLLFVTGGVTAWKLREPMAMPGRLTPAASRLGAALAAAIAAGCAGFAFFDAWSFPWVPSTLFLLFGCVGALRRLTVEDAVKYSNGALSTAVTRRLVPSNGSVQGQFAGMTIWSIAGAVRRRWPVAAAGIIVTLIGSYAAAKAPGVYYEQSAMVLTAPAPSVADGGGSQLGSDSLVSMAGIVVGQLNEQGPLSLSTGATIVGMGIRNGVWVRLPNDGDQWVYIFDRAELDVEVVGSNPTQVANNMTTTAAKIRATLLADQLSVGARQNWLIKVSMSPPSAPVLYVKGSAARAGPSAFALGLILTLIATLMVDRWWGRRTLSARRHRQTRSHIEKPVFASTSTSSSSAEVRPR
jgi:O-antigen ligase